MNLIVYSYLTLVFETVFLLIVQFSILGRVHFHRPFRSEPHGQVILDSAHISHMICDISRSTLAVFCFFFQFFGPWISDGTSKVKVRKLRTAFKSGLITEFSPTGSHQLKVWNWGFWTIVWKNLISIRDSQAEFLKSWDWRSSDDINRPTSEHSLC